MLELHDEPCDEHGRRHGEDGRADNGGGNRKPFVKKNGTVLNDAYAGRHKQQGEVRQKNIDDGKRFFEKTIDGHQSKEKKHHPNDGSGDRDAG